MSIARSGGAAANPKRGHVLMVEDDRLVLVTVARGLRDAGFIVDTAESAEDAQEWLAQGCRPDLALLDLCMPGEDGLWLAQRLRELDRVPFLIFSAYGEAEFVRRASSLGALAYLVKPMDVAQLVPAIETALERAREWHAMREAQAGLQGALDADRDISVAVGLAMAYYRLSRAQAFDLLRKNARTQRRRLADIARQLIASNLTQTDGLSKNT